MDSPLFWCIYGGEKSIQVIYKCYLLAIFLSIEVVQRTRAFPKPLYNFIAFSNLVSHSLYRLLLLQYTSTQAAEVLKFTCVNSPFSVWQVVKLGWTYHIIICEVEMTIKNPEKNITIWLKVGWHKIKHVIVTVSYVVGFPHALRVSIKASK